ncbi:MAG: uracil-DNA glycosylase [Anaerolineae bacterium]|jgi:DNA polymerase
MAAGRQRAKLAQIARKIGGCTLCPLHEERLNPVPGAGPADAEVLFLGEGPGAREDEQGLPFVGASGQFLDQLLEAIELNRDNAFITNVIKCRPPGNRDPHVDEVRACETYLDQQLELIQPRLIVTLGRFAMNHFFPDGRISEIHGQPRRIDGVVYLPLYHPAAALYRASLRGVVEHDFQRIPELLEKPRRAARYRPSV